AYERSARHPGALLVAAVWRESERELRRCNAFEFDDLLACAVRLLAEHPHRLQWLRQRWRWILADEFQDTSHAQAMLVDLLAGPDGNLCVCGDDDQVIYGFRHADPRHIICFHERHPGHAQIVLGRNFRSRAEILEAAVRCVSQNERRAGKALIAMRGHGGLVRVRAFANEYAEANWVTAQIADALAGGTPPAEILALARTGYATEPLQRALAHAGISHRVLGSLGLYERTEVRDALAYLTLLQNPVDAQAFRRAIGSPRRGIGAATVTRLVAWARERHGGDLITASARASELDGVRAQGARARLVEFGAALGEIRGKLAAGRSIGHVAIVTVTMPGGLVRHYQHLRDHTPDPDRRRDTERVLEDLRSLCRAAQAHDEQDEHATLTGFLELAAGLHAQELDATNDRRITVSTIHRAKGVEAQAVALLGCEEELLPSWRSVSSPDPERLAEERRLFYVAATRAKDRLLITHVAERGRRQTGGPSRFLAEAGLYQTPTSLAA
ncbi:MAG: ATP-dependent helicase, partial [Solirubrobacteraceae bacterium]